MPRQKDDGRGRMGGRQKGTPNKATSNLREFVKNIIDTNRKQIAKDLKEADPSTRLAFFASLLPFALQTEANDKEASTPDQNPGSHADTSTK